MKEEPEIFLWKDGHQEGPISLRALDGGVRFGGIPPETPAWTRKDREWKTAAAILKLYSPNLHDEAKVAPAMPTKGFSTVLPTKTSPLASKRAFGIGLAAIFGLPLLLMLIHFNRGRTGSDVVSLSEESVSGVRSAASVAEAEQCVLMVRTDNSAATAFIAIDGGKAYVYTNVHAASSKRVTFTDFRGKPVQVGASAEVVGIAGLSGQDTGVDIVRFPLIETPALALTFASRDLIEQKPDVWTLGDSGGESILKSLQGHIRGVGPYKIEVDCEFIQGNSGGPIVTTDGKVVGIASYMKADQSIWAKGTEQEVRRFGWIPGAPFSWQETSTEDLADEGSIVDDCMITSDLLYVISRLEITPTGLELPEDFPEVVGDFMAQVAAHPLRKGIDQTSGAVMASSGSGGSANITSLREYLRFFNSCVDYQTSRLESAQKSIRSAFWRNELQQRLEFHREILEQFKSELRRYEDSGGSSKTLSDA